ncbi:hypothetical protein BJ508DRAFT_414178 [Ascobolus immersus RN42]|uniref:Transcription factor TFIIIC triple barrel domain-containing protein n=1 Tax=Ascobolus immersus RN42 TaxID=1160509 RepID=A0A3N4I8F2_ASCIM|nr:hypothetical protein BJ508DRAFT_414178 [Ascobolus immersus RN42]
MASTAPVAKMTTTPTPSPLEDWEWEYETAQETQIQYVPLHLPPRQSSTSSLSSTGTIQLLTRATDHPLLALDGRLYVIQPTESIGSYMFLDKQTGEMVGVGREGGVAKAAVVREGGQGDAGKSGARRWREKFGEVKKKREEAEKRKQQEKEAKGGADGQSKETGESGKQQDGDPMEGVERDG